DQVRDLDHDHGQSERSEHPAAVYAHVKMFVVEFTRNRKDPPARPQHPTLCEIMRCAFCKKHSRCCDEQEETEKIENEVKALHQRYAAPDHRAAHDKRPENSPYQNATLCERRNAKMRKNQYKHKNVIHAQRILDEIAG